MVLKKSQSKISSVVLREVIGEGNIVHLEPRHEVKHSIPTFQKSIDLLGFEYKTSLKDGLTQMWEYQNNNQ